MGVVVEPCPFPEAASDFAGSVLELPFFIPPFFLLLDFFELFFLDESFFVSSDFSSSATSEEFSVSSEKYAVFRRLPRSCESTIFFISVVILFPSLPEFTPAATAAITTAAGTSFPNTFLSKGCLLSSFFMLSPVDIAINKKVLRQKTNLTLYKQKQGL